MHVNDYMRSLQLTMLKPFCKVLCMMNKYACKLLDQVSILLPCLMGKILRYSTSGVTRTDPIHKEDEGMA